MSGSENSEQLSREDVTDLDRNLLYGTETASGRARAPLSADDLTDLDDAIRRTVRPSHLVDRHSPVELVAVTAVHFLPALLGVVPALAGVDAAGAATGVGMDLYLLTGLVAFASGVAAHVAREIGPRALFGTALASILAGSAAYAATLVTAAVAPGTGLATGGVLSAAVGGSSAGVVALSLTGGSLVVARLLYERYVVA